MRLATILVMISTLLGTACTGTVQSEPNAPNTTEYEYELRKEREKRLQAEQYAEDRKAVMRDAMAHAEATKHAISESPETSGKDTLAIPASGSPVVYTNDRNTPAATPPAPPAMLRTAFVPSYGAAGPSVGYLEPGNFPFRAADCAGMCVAIMNRTPQAFSVEVNSERMEYIFAGSALLRTHALERGVDGTLTYGTIPLVPGTPAGMRLEESRGRVYFMYACNERDARCALQTNPQATVRIQLYRVSTAETTAKPVGQPCSRTLTLPTKGNWGNKIYVDRTTTGCRLQVI